MADVSVTKLDVRPLNGSITINKVAGGALAYGDAAYFATDGDLEKADADAAASAVVRGIITSTPRTGVTDAVAGDRVDITVYGPVTGFSGLTPGAWVYASTTAGAVADAAPAGASGDYKWFIGWAVDATTIFVNPWTDDFAAQ